MRRGHNFAYATTAELSWHVHNCNLIRSLEPKSKQNQFSQDFHYGLLNHFWNWSQIPAISVAGGRQPRIVAWNKYHSTFCGIYVCVWPSARNKEWAWLPKINMLAAEYIWRNTDMYLHDWCIIFIGIYEVDSTIELLSICWTHHQLHAKPHATLLEARPLGECQCKAPSVYDRALFSFSSYE